MYTYNKCRAHLLNVTVKHTREHIHNKSRFSFSLLFFVTGLKRVLVIGAYFFTLLSVPSSLSAPTSRQTTQQTMDDSQTKWLFPCGFPSESSHDSEPLSVEDIIKLIITQANRTYSKAASFKEEYVSCPLALNSTHILPSGLPSYSSSNV